MATGVRPLVTLGSGFIHGFKPGVATYGVFFPQVKRAVISQISRFCFSLSLNFIILNFPIF